MAASVRTRVPLIPARAASSRSQPSVPDQNTCLSWAIATPNCSVKLSELAVGIGPFVVGPVIEKKIGLGALSAIAVDADWRTAGWAHQHGLYAEVLDSVHALDERVGVFARKLAGYNPEAMRRMKETFWEGTEGWEELLAARAEISGTLVLSDFTRKAIGG